LKVWKIRQLDTIFHKRGIGWSAFANRK